MVKRKRRVLYACIALATAIAVFAATLVVYSAFQNKTVIISEYTVEHTDIPAAFDGKRIVHLTDLHNKDYGGELGELVAAQKPDVIVITGDWIGMLDEDITPAKEQVSALAKVAPIYFVTGNHERASAYWQELKAHLLSCGVTVLENASAEWRIGDDAVSLVGSYGRAFAASVLQGCVSHGEQEGYTILLHHHPEDFETLAGQGFDLILSGHTHGGQIRLPWIGAIFAPGQGWFPQYDAGRFDANDTTMIVGQGLGESVYMRILTPPEIVTVTLRSR